MKIINDNTPIEKILNMIQEKFDSKDAAVTRLAKENKELRDEHYREKELIRLSEELENMRKDCRRGFSITESESKMIQEWKRKHDEEAHGAKTSDERLRLEGCIGGRYSYIFTPTTIGTVGSIQCSCGEKFDFQEL